MNQDEIDFATADLGLAPVVDDDEAEGDDFDAFNADTFGAEDVWVEDDHEELAKFTEEERRAIHDSDSFFDFGNDNDRSAPNGRSESPFRQPTLAALADEVGDKLKLGGPPPAQPVHHQPHPADPAIMNVMRFPPMPPFLPPGVHPNHPMQFPMPQFPAGLNDPAIMSMSQLPPQHLLFLQQQQQLLRQQAMRHQMPPQCQQPPPPIQPGGARTLEEIERQLLGDQRQHDMRPHQRQHQHLPHHQQQQSMSHHQQQHLSHHQHQQQQQQRHQPYQQHQFQQQHHQQQQRGIMNQGRGQNQRNRNPFDDRNRETFGDAFVDHHHHQQRRQQHQGHHLITPGHVHVLGILRGARERRGHGNSGPGMVHESTGNPMRDRELQRLADSRRFGRDDWSRPEPEDEFAGLMSQRERQWIVNIQLSQLKCENPFLDDYYFTVFKLRKQHQQYISARNADPSESETNADTESDPTRRPKPEEEGAQLLIQPDSPRTPYMPLQFSNSLGKLQAATVKAPRKIIDVGILNSDSGEAAAQKETRNFKLTLLELERLYNLLIEVEDCEKKLLALPTNTSMRVQVEEERNEAVKKFGANLIGGNRLKRYLTVRKGKTLVKRGLRLLDDLQMGLVCTNLLQFFASILKKDREEQLLSEFWDHGLRKHLLAAPFELAQHYLALIASKSFSIKPLVTSSLGSSMLITIVHRVAVLSQDQNENSGEVKSLVTSLAGKLSETTDLCPPLKSFSLQLPVCGLAASSLQQLKRLQEVAVSVQ